MYLEHSENLPQEISQLRGRYQVSPLRAWRAQRASLRIGIIGSQDDWLWSVLFRCGHFSCQAILAPFRVSGSLNHHNWDPPSVSADRKDICCTVTSCTGQTFFTAGSHSFGWSTLGIWGKMISRALRASLSLSVPDHHPRASSTVPTIQDPNSVSPSPATAINPRLRDTTAALVSSSPRLHPDSHGPCQARSHLCT